MVDKVSPAWERGHFEFSNLGQKSSLHGPRWWLYRLRGFRLADV